MFKKKRKKSKRVNPNIGQKTGAMRALSPDIDISDVIDLQNCFDNNGLRHSKVTAKNSDEENKTSTKDDSQQMTPKDHLNNIEKSQNNPKPPSVLKKIKHFYRPISKEEGTLKLIIIRKNGGFSKLYPKYIMTTEKSQFLLNAKKKAYNKTSNYMISMESNKFDKKHDSYLGKLRAISGKIKYVIYDDGESTKDFFNHNNISQSKLRNELGAIMYSHKVNTNNEVSMSDFLNTTLVIPSVNQHDNSVQFKPLNKTDSLVEKFNSDPKTDHDIFMFEKRRPRWSQQRNSYVLNFGPRVKQASVKNTQLVQVSKDDADQDEVFFQLGKIDNKRFSLDLKWPLSLMQGFGIALSIFDQ